MPSKPSKPSKAVKEAQEDFDIREQSWWPKELSGDPKGLRKIKVDIKLKAPLNSEPNKPVS